MFCNSVLAKRVQWGAAAVWNSCSWRRTSSALQPMRVKTNMQKKRVACLRATRNWVDLFEAVFPTAFKHIVPNLVGLSGAGSRCGPTWLSSKSRLVVSSVVPATDDSLSINVNVKTRWPWSRNAKDLEDCCRGPVLGAEMGFLRRWNRAGWVGKRGGFLNNVFLVATVHRKCQRRVLCVIYLTLIFNRQY